MAYSDYMKRKKAPKENSYGGNTGKKPAYMKQKKETTDVRRPNTGQNGDLNVQRGGERNAMSVLVNQLMKRNRA